jgi:tRNA 2-selenouridine synthase
MTPISVSESPLPRDRATVAHLPQFDELLDVRTPLEFAEDHIPGASNLPVLSNDQRAQVGTLYKQVSPFSARKLGAALVSANIARHLEGPLRDKPRGWRPLVYCWRGGQRSKALTHVLREIGWDARQLEGGYKAFRRAVIADTPGLAQRLDLRVICGMTGSGKSRLLRALERVGAQVLDLEGLAAHKGSVLGALPDAPQPSQKMFESRLWQRLQQLDPGRPVYVESESKRIGAVQVPQGVLDHMWASPCTVLHTAMAARVELLKQEYAHFLRNPDALGQQLDRLVALHGHVVIERWKTQAHAGEWDRLVEDLLVRHYDPTYGRSIGGHYTRLSEAESLHLDSAEHDAFLDAARALTGAVAEPVAG